MAAPYHQLKLDKHGRPQAIYCHAWNADRTQIAFCPNNNELHIARWDGTKFTTEHVLKEHDQLITSVDWAPSSNRIVSCSQDRNAYVWTFDSSSGKAVWNPVMVMLHMNRAVTCVKWSPSEKKFAAASGQKAVAICHFDEEFNWWASKLIEGVHFSTVLTLSWHASDVLLATGAADGKARIISVAVKGVDSKPAPVFGNAKPSRFGNVEAEFACGGWVHAVGFSPSGNELAMVSHNAMFHVAKLPSDRKPTADDVTSINCSGLPFRCLLFLSDDRVVCGGHDCNPTVFVKSPQGWKEGKKLDVGKSSAAAAKTSAMSSAFRKFETATARAGEDSSSANLDTVHQNAISDIRAVKNSGSTVSSFSTTGVDGRLVFWDIPAIEAQIGGLA